MSHTHSFVKFIKSNKPGKKYTAILKNKKTGRIKNVHFGASAYEHYKDTTGLGKWSHKNHNDTKRRDNFRKRMARSKNNKYSPGWFSYHYLW